MLNIHYAGKGVPVLCLHGWGFNHTIWQTTAACWPSKWQRIMVDLPGHGQTPAMPMSMFTSALLSQLPPEFAVVGWSLGGLYAFELAVSAPDRLLHLAAVATSPCFVKQTNWPGIETSVLTRFYRQFQKSPHQTIEKFIELQLIDQQPHRKIAFNPSMPSDSELGLNLLKMQDYRESIRGLSRSISFMLGRQDSIVPASVATALPIISGVADVHLIDKCGHMPFLSHTKQFIRHLEERLP